MLALDMLALDMLALDMLALDMLALDMLALDMLALDMLALDDERRRCQAAEGVRTTAGGGAGVSSRFGAYSCT